MGRTPYEKKRFKVGNGRTAEGCKTCVIARYMCRSFSPSGHGYFINDKCSRMLRAKGVTRQMERSRPRQGEECSAEVTRERSIHRGEGRGISASRTRAAVPREHSPSQARNPQAGARSAEAKASGLVLLEGAGAQSAESRARAATQKQKAVARKERAEYRARRAGKDFTELTTSGAPKNKLRKAALVQKGSISPGECQRQEGSGDAPDRRQEMANGTKHHHFCPHRGAGKRSHLQGCPNRGRGGEGQESRWERDWQQQAQH